MKNKKKKRFLQGRDFWVGRDTQKSENKKVNFVVINRKKYRFSSDSNSVYT